MSPALAATLIALTFGPPAPNTQELAEAADRNDQWLYRRIEGYPYRLAVFLSWDYRTALFRAWCEPDGRLLLVYVDDEETDPDALDDPIVLVLESGELPLETTRVGDAREGRLTLTPQAVRRITASPWISIETGLVLAEPWHTAGAEPLKQIVRECAE